MDTLSVCLTAQWRAQGGYESGFASSMVIEPYMEQLLQEWYCEAERVAVPPRWRLLWCGTLHGFSASDFHQRCDFKGPTCTVVKTETNYVFGGYTPSPWTSRNSFSGSGGKAFVFSLLRAGAPSLVRLSVVNDKRATYNGTVLGPTFGAWTFLLQDNCNVHRGNRTDTDPTYEQPPGVAEPELGSYLAGQPKGWLVHEVEVWERKQSAVSVVKQTQDLPF
eukprot:TRINITY_DN2516_c0_g1_i1.p1 TRINITY_DN2516_c0_g1~~TRINITY_DN2516_c0_g1_i1.p1  ORF type:complete len:220 (+),score=51.78 TRINITY_DN2516_c0_g1_i1:288-947(+)